jgi:hypothetical protein
VKATSLGLNIVLESTPFSWAETSLIKLREPALSSGFSWKLGFWR